MKMSAETYDLLKTALDRLQKIAPTICATHKAAHTPERYRWDLFWALPDARVRAAVRAEHLNDAHIDTALRRALREEN